MFKAGDKVVVVENPYPTERRVGDVGEVVDHTEGLYPYIVKFENSVVTYPFKEGEVALAETTADRTATGRIIPDDDSRENYPLFDVLVGYFPAAMCELSRWSKVGNEQHNPGEELHWAREKSTDHRNKILRHLMDYDQKDSNGFYEAIPLLWRAAALAQELLEKDGWPEGRNARRKDEG